MNVTPIPVPVPTLAPGGTTNAYLVGEERSLLVDPPAASEELDDAVDDGGVAHVAVTHTHPDHVGAVARYAERTGATVWARRGREGRFEHATGLLPDRTFVEGTPIPVDGGAATVLDVPGHAVDHVAFAVPARDGVRSERADPGGRPREAILCGDVAVAEGSVVVGAPEGDMRAYLTALRRLRARDPATLYPGHGRTIDDPRATLDRLVQHRLRRERRVLAAVGGGASDLDGVLDRAYDKDLSGVRDLARATVRAHVEKLARAGRFAWNRDTGRVEPVAGESAGVGGRPPGRRPNPDDV